MRTDVQAIIQQRYVAARRNHTRNGVRFELTLEEFIALWNSYRIRKLESFIDSGDLKGLQRWLKHPDHGPVCTWVSKEARSTGVISVDTAHIATRKESKWTFYLRAGEQHTPETLQKMRTPKRQQHRMNMRKPKSEEHRRKMSEAAKARWARAREQAERDTKAHP